MPYTRPGVYVSETPLRATAPRPASAATAAFFGTADRGPTVPTLLDSWPAFKSLFGDLSQNHDLGYAVYHYFANGGRVAYVTRVTGTGATAASTNGFTYEPTGTTTSPLFTVEAKNAGTWGNSLSATLSAGKVSATATTIPTFNLSVLLNGVEVEYWTELSADAGSSRFVEEVLNNYSSYVTVSGTAAVIAHGSFAYTAGTQTFASGSDGATVIGSNYSSALSLLNDVEESLLINLVGQYASDVVQAALTYAEGRGNSFVIVDPDPSATTSGAVNSVVDAYPDSGYGAVYYPMLRMIDPMKSGPAAVRTTFPGGAVAGAYVRTDAQRTVAKTPAGYNVDLRNTLGLATKISDAFVSAVYDQGVNCLKAVPGAGVVILGGRTLSKVRPDEYISVRRSLNFIKQGVSDIARSAVFEPNGPTLWDRLTTNINKFLTTFWGQGGLKGASASQAFYVVCDETNNTSTTIDNGEVHIEVGVALQYPAEFIVINISEWAGGSNIVENL